jgi:BMFP domain-containing protein YqiC
MSKKSKKQTVSKQQPSNDTKLILEKLDHLENRITGVENGLNSVRTDLTNEISAVRDEISAVRTDLTNEISAVRTDLTNEISAVRTDLTNEISAVRDEISAVRTDLTNEISAVRTDLTNQIKSVDEKADRIITYVLQIDKRLTKVEETMVSKQEFENLVGTVDQWAIDLRHYEVVSLADRERLKDYEKRISSLETAATN